MVHPPVPQASSGQPSGYGSPGQPSGYAAPGSGGYPAPPQPTPAHGSQPYAGQDHPTQQLAPVPPQQPSGISAGPYPGAAHPAPAYPAQGYPAPSYPAPSYPAQSYPAPSYPARGYPVATYVVPPPAAPQRPAVVAMSASMTVTAAALWVCALATAWLFAAAGERRLAADQDFDGQVLIVLNRFSARLLDGLAVPLFGLPALAFVAAFLLLSGRRWAQVLYTVLGAVTVGWLAWWLGDRWGWAVAPIAYVLISTVILWTPAARRWFGRRT